MRVINKKWIGTAAAAALAGVMMIGGTFAFLTDSADKTNTFTVGNVDIEVEEPEYDKAVKNKENENIVPLQKIAKDPTVLVKTEVPTLVFMKVTVPKKNVSIYTQGEDPEISAPAVQEIYNILGSNQNHNAGWIELESVEDDTKSDYRTYVFGYETVMSSKVNNDKTAPLFNAVQLKNLVSTEDLGDINIKIDAYAIQASYLTGDDSVLIAGESKLDATGLTNAFAIYNGHPVRTYTNNTASTTPTSDSTSTGDPADSGSTQTQDPQDPDTNSSTGE